MVKNLMKGLIITGVAVANSVFIYGVGRASYKKGVSDGLEVGGAFVELQRMMYELKEKHGNEKE